MPPASSTRKRARFGLEKDYEVYTVPHRWDYNAAVRAEIWVSRQEYQEIREDIKRIGTLMDRRNQHFRQKLALIQECTRGLEAQTQRGAVAKKVACLDGICAVLMEQEHQQSMGGFCVEAIRRRYIAMNSVHVEAAYRRAEKDADHLNEETTPTHSTKSAGTGTPKARLGISNARQNNRRISRLLFRGPLRSNGYEKGRRIEEPF